ncbi:MAG: putative quinol monooxygenase [Methanobacteriaceae archaeon]|nr:putative quinol monooxygenase [Methanobacteriaceae archaeon]
MILVLAKAIPKKGSENKIIDAAQNLIKNSRAENGNIDYNLYSSTEDNSLTFVEKWESKEILDKHLKTNHFIDFGNEIKDYLEAELDIQILSAEILN